MDLDDNELKATRESNGSDRRGVEEDIKRLKERINNIKKYDTYRYDWTETDIQTIEHLIKSYKELEEENQQLEAIKDEAIRRYNFESIPVSLVEEKIEEYFEDEEWLVEHDLRALCDDEKECREYYTNKKIALKDIKKAILDKLNKLLKNY